MSEGPEGRQLSPGQWVARRYRIHRLVGAGGMGEVYRAEDIVLGQPVALKVPPPTHPKQEVLLEKLHKEVRAAHRVTHPNVCRVYDLTVDEESGLTLLSMEYIDGETLRQVLDRRGGRLSRTEKRRIAHELCSGLAAVHRQGLVHRDLKPANVMVDGRGRTVLMDLGLAEDPRRVRDPKSGARAYKAPEQHQGRAVSLESDLYSLGLLLHEIFTGRHPYRDPPRKSTPQLSQDKSSQGEAAGESSLRASHRDLSQDDLMASLKKELGLDEEPAARFAHQIRRCLEKQPERRPNSVEEVADALPGDPLEPFEGTSTPVYRLLVEPTGGLSRRGASAALAATLLGLVLAGLLTQQVQPLRAALAGQARYELEDRARDLVTRLGLDDTPRDRLSGFTPGPDRVRFWYRQSPRRLQPLANGSVFHRYEDPPLTTPGEVALHLDPRGRLVRLDAVPATATAEPGSRGLDWGLVFAAAGLDLDRFRPSSPAWIPPSLTDHRRAWVERGPPEPIRVEAAALDGRPVAFRVLDPGPLSVPEPYLEAPRLATPGARVAFSLWFGAVLLGAAWLARRKLRERIADRPAAFRLALFVFGARTLVGLLCAHHLWSPSELVVAQAQLARALLAAALVWVIYLAVEPWVRYYHPQGAASWIRLVYGRIRDPRVGRDLQIGGLFGIAALLWARLYGAVPASLGLPSPRPEGMSPLLWMIGQRETDLQCEAMRGFGHTLGMATYAAVHAVLVAFFAVCGLYLLRRLLGRAWLSRSVAFLLFLWFTFPGTGPLGLDLVAAAGASLLWLVVLLRFGFLAAVTATVFTWVLSSHPLTLDPTNWAFPGAGVPLLLTSGLSLWGFWASTARGKTRHGQRGIQAEGDPGMAE